VEVAPNAGYERAPGRHSAHFQWWPPVGRQWPQAGGLRWPPTAIATATLLVLRRGWPVGLEALEHAAQDDAGGRPARRRRLDAPGFEEGFPPSVDDDQVHVVIVAGRGSVVNGVDHR
jgi:hypothetical protein